MTKGLRAFTAAIMLIAGSPALSSPPPVPTLKGLEPGEWELRERAAEGGKGQIHRLCLSDLRQFIQIRHARNSCKRLTIDDRPDRLVVSYDCGGAGGGRTDLRIETPRLAQIQSQGIADGAPFSFAIEARKTGACR